MQDAADDLVKLYKRVSLDDDLDDALRSELLSQLSAGASNTAATLRLVYGEVRTRHTSTHAHFQTCTHAHLHTTRLV